LPDELWRSRVCEGLRVSKEFPVLPMHCEQQFTKIANLRAAEQRCGLQTKNVGGPKLEQTSDVIELMPGAVAVRVHRIGKYRAPGKSKLQSLLPSREKAQIWFDPNKEWGWPSLSCFPNPERSGRAKSRWLRPDDQKPHGSRGPFHPHVIENVDLPSR
jgi:hypothetical protein